MNRIENTYEQWMKEEGVPIINEYVCSIYQEGMEETWGTGAFIRLEGSEGSYLAEIPPGARLSQKAPLQRNNLRFTR
jgi:hypothetical protein